MKTSNLLRFVCISFAWYSVRSGYVKVRAEEPAGDDPILVRTLPRVEGRELLGCNATATTKTCYVRVQSFKTSNGSEYSRQLVTTADLPCFTRNTTKTLPAATSIDTCAEATAEEGLNSFLWEGGTCTAYVAWRPRTRADCREGGSKVVYVVKKPLMPFSGGELVVTGGIRYMGPNIYVDISSYYDYCGFGPVVSKGYKLRWNSTEELTLPEGTTTHSMGYKILSLGSLNVSLWSIDAAGQVNSIETAMNISRDLNHWYELPSGAFVYLSPTKNTYTGSIADCSSWGIPTLFSAKVDGEAASFLKAWNSSETNVTDFFVGLENVGGNWTWTGGLAQPNVDATVWSAPQLYFVDKCAVVAGNPGKKKVYTTNCNKKCTVVCYVPPI